MYAKLRGWPIGPASLGAKRNKTFAAIIHSPAAVMLPTDASLYLGHPQSGRFNEARNPAK